MLNLLLSTVAFFAAAWYLNRYFEQEGIAEGKARRIVVTVLASVVSFGVSEAINRLDPPPAKIKPFTAPAQPAEQ